MIDPGYARLMARYNSWQNKQLSETLDAQPDTVLRAERGAFFGSILATLNHVLWGDAMWMSRFDPKIPKPDIPGSQSVGYMPTFAVWSAERFRMDGAIRMWADTLSALDLHGQMSWMSGITGREVRLPVATCVTHMFNHQTHHRGQVHAMMTAAGLRAPISDIVFMPEDVQ